MISGIFFITKVLNRLWERLPAAIDLAHYYRRGSKAAPTRNGYSSAHHMISKYIIFSVAYQIFSMVIGINLCLTLYHLYEKIIDNEQSQPL